MSSSVASQERLLAMSVACVLAVGVFVFVRSRRKKHVILSEERILPAQEQQSSQARSPTSSSNAVPVSGHEMDEQ